jgi:hypothetical protein
MRREKPCHHGQSRESLQATAVSSRGFHDMQVDQRLRVPLDMRTGGRGCKLFKRNMTNKGGLVAQSTELRGIIGLSL